jgi:hypothetical protein
MDVWNTYAEWSEAECLARIRLLQDQISGGATATNGPSGGAQFAAAEKAKLEIWELRCRLAEIRGLPRPPPSPRNDRGRLRMRWMRVDYDGGY